MQETPLLVIFILLQKKKKRKTVFESTVCFLCTIKNIKLNFKSSYQKDEKGQSRSGGEGRKNDLHHRGEGEEEEEGRTGRSQSPKTGKQQRGSRRKRRRATRLSSSSSPRGSVQHSSFWISNPSVVLLKKTKQNSRILKTLKGARNPPQNPSPPYCVSSPPMYF